MNTFIRVEKTNTIRNLPLLDFDVSLSSFEKKENVDIIILYLDCFLFTPKGTLFFNIEFGTTIYNYIGEQLDEQTISEIKISFINELLVSLPMIDIGNVSIFPSFNEKGVIVEIEFTFDNQIYKVTRNITTPLKRVY